MTIVVRIPDNIWNHYQRKYESRDSFNYFLKKTIQRLNIYIGASTDIYFILPNNLTNQDFYYISYLAYSQFAFYINHPTEAAIHVSNSYINSIMV